MPPPPIQPLPRKIAELAGELAAASGVVAVVLGGSRATGTADDDSDVPPADPSALEAWVDAIATRLEGAASPSSSSSS